MKLDLYTYCFNDEEFIPFFFDYYTKIVDRITIVDNGSTDNTVKLIKSYAKVGGPIIRIAYSGMTFWDWDYGLVIRNTIWKDSDYDFIVWADLDEIIYHKNLRGYLKKSNCDIYLTEGYDMVSNIFPKKGTDILDIKMGIRSGLLDKYLIWKRGSRLISTSAHSIAKINENVCKGEIKLLHYKYLGVDIMVKRAEQIKSRVPLNSYCKAIRGNILKIFPTFVKTRKEYVAEIAEKMSVATKII